MAPLGDSSNDLMVFGFPHKPIWKCKAHINFYSFFWGGEGDTIVKVPIENILKRRDPILPASAVPIYRTNNGRPPLLHCPWAVFLLFLFPLRRVCWVQPGNVKDVLVSSKKKDKEDWLKGSRHGKMIPLAIW